MTGGMYKHCPETLSWADKRQRLLQLMDGYAQKDCVIAFSGGVDSSLLVRLACEQAAVHHTTVYAVMIQSELGTAGQAGAQFVVLNIHELTVPQIAQNHVDRCYVCKKYLFSRLLAFAREKNIDTVLEGTNADDLKAYRPGIRAIRELGVLSPLVQAQMTKAEVRRLAEEYGISVASRPSAPCLATRFPYNTRLTVEALRKVEQGEQILREMGFTQVRLRLHGTIARIEVLPEQMQQFMAAAPEIVRELKALGYDYVTLDLEGFRSGSMDLHVRHE